jgi:DNA repair protein RadC
MKNEVINITEITRTMTCDSSKTDNKVLPTIQIKYNKTHEVYRKIRCSQDVFEYMRPLFNQDTINYREEMILILLFQDNTPIGYYRISQGGTSGTVCDPKILFSVALCTGACAFAIAHNHPSGNLKPSQPDVYLTNKLNEASKLLDLRMVDHVIIAENKYLSFADEGLI